MSDVNLSNLISKFVNYHTLNQPKKEFVEQKKPFVPDIPKSAQTPAAKTDISAPKMGEMGGTDNSALVKDMMKLPKNMNELFYMMQRNITLAQLNRQFANQINSQRAMLSQTQAQILAQLQGLSPAEAQNILTSGNKAILTQFQSSLRNLPLSANGLINLNDISAMIQINGKDAIAKLITTMANSAKLGIQDMSQLKDTAKLINASVAAASKNDSAQTMKLLMLLYLPWLPLQEGVGFDIEIEQGNSGNESDSILIITITTVNYGNVAATLILENSNSVHVNIECAKDFPKDELMLRIEGDEKHYSMESVVSFETNESVKPQQNQEKPQAKINMSDTNEINPYLLLIAHTIIRHVIEIDKNTSNGITSHTDI
ncbi:hypothetical protein J6P92_07875 [bacterium]|nr:hypothetical protein [bacterium]